MLKSFSPLTFLLIFVILGFSACDDDDADDIVATDDTLADLVAADPQFSTLLAALNRVGLVAPLDDASNTFTVFAPTNQAFTDANINLDDLSDEELTNVLNYHLLPGRIVNRTEDIQAGDSELVTNNITSVGDNSIPISINRDGTTLTFNGGVATSTGEPLLARNGAIFVIDGLLLPPSIADRATRAGNFTTLLAALKQTGLDTVLAAGSDFTVFAPTDDAFTAAGFDLDDFSNDDDGLRQVLLYHVLGTGVTAGDIAEGQSFQTTLSTAGPDDAMLSLLVDKTGDAVKLNNDANVVAADLFATNGIIHAIDTVLMMQSVVQFAVIADGLDSLALALTTTEIVADLLGDGPFTVFAPVNAAFVAASDTIAKLADGQLNSILLNHVAAGNTRSGALTDGMEITTLSGQNVSVSTKDAAGVDRTPVVFTSDSTEVNFIQTDIQATNGVIHLIDGILLPKLD